MTLENDVKDDNGEAQMEMSYEIVDKHANANTQSQMDKFHSRPSKLDHDGRRRIARLLHSLGLLQKLVQLFSRQASNNYTKKNNVEQQNLERATAVTELSAENGHICLHFVSSGRPARRTGSLAVFIINTIDGATATLSGQAPRRWNTWIQVQATTKDC